MADRSETAGCALIEFNGSVETTAFHQLIATTSAMTEFDLLVIAGGPCEIDVTIGAAAAEFVIVSSIAISGRGKFGARIPCVVPANARLSCRAHTDRKRMWPTDWVAVSVEAITNG
jgi:hypothetical protein